MYTAHVGQSDEKGEERNERNLRTLTFWDKEFYLDNSIQMIRDGIYSERGK